MIPRSKIRSRAVELLNQFEVCHPPVDVETIARGLGVRVKYTSFERDEVSGLLVRKGDEVVLGVNREHPETRRRFTIAHEIGHFVLHMTRLIFVDEVVLHFRDRTSGEGRDPEEIEANAFAAELLMPEHFIEEDMEELDVWDDEGIQELAQKYQVSTQSLIYRLNHLGYLLDL